MANMYRSVLSGGGTSPTGDAVAADVLSGKTFSNAQATGISGTMVNNGAVSETLSAGQTYTIPAGYHNGNGTVTASPLNITGMENVTFTGGAGQFDVVEGEYYIITSQSASPTYVSGRILTVTAQILNTHYLILYKATSTGSENTGGQIFNIQHLIIQ